MTAPQWKQDPYIVEVDRKTGLIRCPVCLGPTNRLDQWEYECAAALTDCSVISFTIEASRAIKEAKK